MRLNVETHRLHLLAPMPTAHGTITARDLVMVTAEEGAHSGAGEAAPLPGFGLESLGEATDQLRRWADSGTFPDTPAAAAAAHCALDQLRAAQRGTSLDGLLRDKQPSPGPLAIQALIADPEPDRVAQVTSAAIDAGHSAVKLKVAVAPVAVDIDRIHAAHAHLPSGTLLRLDANQGWTREEAEHVLDAVAHIGIDLIEEPTAELSDFGPLAEHGVRVAADEHLVDPAAVVAVVEGRLAEVLVLKPATLGGPRATYDLARHAIDNGLSCIVSSFIDGPTGLRAARDLAIAVDPDGVHGVGTATLFSEPLPPDVTPRRGALHRETIT
ncbi:MAG: o-succinylbenzoate synthase [Actinomycetota bacterium]|jgi:L-Ala-D/L-Glu epimerase|nr:o-succinylbenzoate synthase [Actinomycetota bacterium]